MASKRSSTRSRSVTPVAPPPPLRADGSELLASTRARWAALWASAWARSGALDMALDGRQLQQYARDLDELERVEAALAPIGPVVEAGASVQVNPLLPIRDALAARVARTEEEFGLTPASRARLAPQTRRM